eukprot:jgi/Galph1/1801/GphlegSOOS_G469.1
MPTEERLLWRKPRRDQQALEEEDLQESVFVNDTGRRPVAVSDADFLYLDDRCLVVNKPADVRMDGNFDITLEKLVQKKLNTVFNTSSVPKARFVHQLDYATSGALIAGLDRKTAGYLSKLFRERRIGKQYLALVHGWTPCKRFVVQKDIALHPVDGFMMTIGTYTNPGWSAKTECIPLSFGMCHGYIATKMLLKPVTGRRHQLRLHMLDSGFPIIGDATYGQDSIHGPDDPRTPPRMMLHAWKLKFSLPNGRELEIEAPDPFLSIYMEESSIVHNT